MMGTSVNIRMGLKVFQKGVIIVYIYNIVIYDIVMIHISVLLPPQIKSNSNEKEARAVVTDLHLIGLDHEETLQMLREETIKITETDSTFSGLI